MKTINADYIQRQQEKYTKAKRKARKKGLPAFPDTDRDDVIAEVRADLASLYDDALAASKRTAQMGRPSVDTERFPAARGGN